MVSSSPRLTSLLLAYARVIEWSYDFNETSIKNFLTAFLGPAWTITWTAPTVQFPAVTLATSTEGTLVIVDGTANYVVYLDENGLRGRSGDCSANGWWDKNRVLFEYAEIFD